MLVVEFISSKYGVPQAEYARVVADVVEMVIVVVGSRSVERHHSETAPREVVSTVAISSLSDSDHVPNENAKDVHAGT